MFCIWLLPTFRQALDIESVSHKNMLNRPSFQAHMTLFDSRQPLTTSVQDQFKKIVTDIHHLKMAPIMAEVVHPCIYSDQFFRAYYLPIKINHSIQTIYEQIKTMDTTTSYSLCPHISLAYGNGTQQPLQSIDLQSICF